MPRFWNLYKATRTQPAIGDRVRYLDEEWIVAGTAGADSQGVPYIRLQPVHDGSGARGQEKVCLVTAVDKAAD